MGVVGLPVSCEQPLGGRVRGVEGGGSREEAEEGVESRMKEGRGRGDTEC